MAKTAKVLDNARDIGFIIRTERKGQDKWLFNARFNNNVLESIWQWIA